MSKTGPLPSVTSTMPKSKISAFGLLTIFSNQQLNGMTFIVFFTRGQFWPSGIVVARVCVCVCVYLCACQSLACPRDNSRPVQARITKFGPKMQKTLVKVPMVLWTDRPSRSNCYYYYYYFFWGGGGGGGGGAIDLDLQSQI